VVAPVLLDDDELEVLRLSKARRVGSDLGLIGAWLVLLSAPPHFLWVDVSALLIFIGVVILKHRSGGRDGLELHSAFLVVRRGWTGWAAAACDIEDIRLERRWPWSSRNLTIAMKNGKRHIAHSAGRSEGLFKETFDRDLQRVRDWWLANRDLDVVVIQVDRTRGAA
jgi:hypothetical protein